MVVGAYRLLRQDVAEANFGFYSAAEIQVGALIARHPGKRFLELGRSCVADGLSRQAHARAALARHLGLCAAPSHRRDVRLREFSRRGSARPRRRARLSARRRSDRRIAPGGSTRSARGGLALAAIGGTAARPARDRARAAAADQGLLAARGQIQPRGGRRRRLSAPPTCSSVLPVEDIRSRYLAHFAPPDHR